VADYLRGKLLGLFAVVGVATLAGPLVLGLVRVALAAGEPGFARTALVVPELLLVGTVQTAAMVLPAAALGALLGKKTPARVAFALVWSVYSHFVWGLSQILHRDRLRLLSPDSCADAITAYFLASHTRGRLPDPGEAAVVLAGLFVGIYVYLVRRVRSAESAGLGAV
jgi:hypothetical protein